MFSCRVFGMGIEQFVYSYFNYPNNDVKGNVSVRLVKNMGVPWVNFDSQTLSSNDYTKKSVLD